MTTISIEISPELMQACGGNIHIELRGGGPAAAAGHAARSTETVGAYIERLVRRMEDEGRHSTAANYRCALRSIDRLCGGGKLTLERIDEAAMRHYEARLKHDGLKMNTVSFYMRTLRAAYNMAVSEGLTPDRHPFRSVYTGIGATGKRAVGLDTIRMISRMQPGTRRMAMARDMFMFNFYTRGMAFIDMAYLKKADLHDGILTYRRHKTGQTLTMKWEKCMQDIIDAHPTGGSAYLLPIIRDAGRDSRKQYKNMQNDINLMLRRMARGLHLEANLTMYVARHSWASIAKDMDIPISVISEALGHSSLKTTQIYLKSIDRTAIDRANSKIIGRM